MIDRFQNPDRSHIPLSNFYPSPFIYNGHLWPTVEHFYQAAKTLDYDEQEEVRNCSTPGKAKRRGRTVTLRPDWEAVKLPYMRSALLMKFPRILDSELSEYLRSTGDQMLIEGNTWGDTFWGQCNGEGWNWLGVLLMARRAELRAD